MGRFVEHGSADSVGIHGKLADKRATYGFVGVCPDEKTGSYLLEGDTKNHLLEPDPEKLRNVAWIYPQTTQSMTDAELLHIRGNLKVVPFAYKRHSTSVEGSILNTVTQQDIDNDFLATARKNGIAVDTGSTKLPDLETKGTNVLFGMSLVGAAGVLATTGAAIAGAVALAVASGPLLIGAGIAGVIGIGGVVTGAVATSISANRFDELNSPKQEILDNLSVRGGEPGYSHTHDFTPEGIRREIITLAANKHLTVSFDKAALDQRHGEQVVFRIPNSKFGTPGAEGQPQYTEQTFTIDGKEGLKGTSHTTTTVKRSFT